MINAFNAAEAIAVGDTLQDRVRRSISADIESGVYKPGDRLPAEKDLAASLGVSLAPVRVALEQLTQRGVLIRVQGKGTFVTERRVQYRLESWRSCTEDLRAQGIAFTTAVLTSGTGAPPEEVTKALSVSPTSDAYRLTRVISVDGTPAILLDSWSREVDAGRFGDGSMFTDGRSLYAELRQQGIEIVGAETSIEVSFTDELESSLFNCAYAAPLLQVTGVAFTKDGPREWSRLKYNAATFAINMRWGPGAPQQTPDGTSNPERESCE